MDKISKKILKVLSKEREISLAYAKKLLPVKFNDYRDFYPLATLCTNGMARTDLQNESYESEKFLASFFYAHTLGVGSHKVNNYVAQNRGRDDHVIRINITSKGSSYLSERHNKNIERLINTSIGFVLGIASTVLSLWLKAKWFA